MCQAERFCRDCLRHLRDLNRSRCSAPRKTPSTVALLQETSRGETAKRYVGSLEIEPRAQSNAGLCIGSGADRLKACCLRLTQVYENGDPTGHTFEFA